MSYAEDDEDLRRAIALSLLPIAREDVVVIEDSEDEDDDLDKPQTCKPNLVAKQTNQGLPTTRHLLPGAQDDIQPIAVGLLGLNRRQMENDRLSRTALQKGKEDASTAKRKASTSLAPSDDRFQRPRLGNILNSFRTTTAKSQVRDSSDHSVPVQKGNSGEKAGSGALETRKIQSQELALLPHDSSPEVAATTSTKLQPYPFSRRQPGVPGLSGLQYPDGVVKKTWALGYDRNGDDIKIEEVLQKSDLEVAVLSSFQVDADWVTSKLDVRTKVTWVLQAKDEAQKRNWASDAPTNFRFCFPSMGGIINCMHSKLMLLAHKTHLRLVIPSANLTPYDWGETGCLENVCFLIDLPRLPDQTDLEILTPFGKELLRFLRAMGLAEAQINSMKNFDFTKTAQFAFVHSIGGSHIDTQNFTTGLCSLGKAIRDLGLNTESALDIDFLAASIGNLNEGFLKSIYLAAKGDDGSTEYEWRVRRPKKKGGIDSDTENRVADEVLRCCRIYFPLRETVQQSKGGMAGAGTICFQPKFWASGTFPRALMRDCISQRKGLLMHSKMIFVRPKSAAPAWAYVGSHNLSESAWGRIVQDSTTKQPKLNIRNWECGVVIPVSAQSTNPAKGDMSVFNGIPVPMIVPGEEYQNRTPWFFSAP